MFEPSQAMLALEAVKEQTDWPVLLLYQKVNRSNTTDIINNLNYTGRVKDLEKLIDINVEAV